MRLPSGDELAGPAVVVVVKENGMGVKFDLPPEASHRLAVALAQIAARPRRGRGVDDDARVGRMRQDAFQQRGFEVLTAIDGATGLSTVVDELLALDLLVTDIKMPNMDGQTFIRTIRGAGGEADLAIVAVTGNVDPALEKRLERDGADAVLDKELGPDIIARAADAVLERKRTKGG
jgi:CheY-like chemotaxis protein